MNRGKLNLIIDALLLLSLAGIVGIGLLMNYVLVPGFQRMAVYGRNVELSLMGMDRHQWGTIHYIAGLVFAALMVLHVVLHWGMIVSLARQLLPSRPLRWTAAIVLLAATALLVVAGRWATPDVSETGGRGHGRSRHGRSLRHRGPPG